jgi:hypothetical protein
MVEMKKIAMAIVLVICFINFSDASTSETKEILFLSPKYLKLSFDYKINFHSVSLYDDLEQSTEIFLLNGNNSIFADYHSKKLKNVIARFSLAAKGPSTFFLKIPSEIISIRRDKNNHSKTALEIAGMNITLWAYDKYIKKESWANISLESIIKNFEDGATWDFDTLATNHLMHPYHGAIHYSIARSNESNFYESAIYSFLGSFMWEFILETRGTKNNPPSTNDLIMNTFGGAIWGEALFRMADLVIDESSRGFERALRESFAILINPAYGLRLISGEAFKKGNPLKKHYYSLELPFGVYKNSSNNKLNLLVAADMEYKDFLKKESSEINPYDWFSFDFRLGHCDKGFCDAEILTTGIIAGKRIKNGLAGLFGVFDYLDTSTADKIASVGVGPGLVTYFVNDSDLFFNSSGVLSLIVGASSPSLDPEFYHFGKKKNEPYYFGPGILGRVKLEFGKKNLGSIETGFSQYWVHSIYTDADEFLAILSLNIKYDLSYKSQISLGYDYYLRHASLQERYFTGAKPAFRALYVYKF